MLLFYPSLLFQSLLFEQSTYFKDIIPSHIFIWQCFNFIFYFVHWLPFINFLICQFWSLSFHVSGFPPISDSPLLSCAITFNIETLEVDRKFSIKNSLIGGLYCGKKCVESAVSSILSFPIAGYKLYCSVYSERGWERLLQFYFLLNPVQGSKPGGRSQELCFSRKQTFRAGTCIKFTVESVVLVSTRIWQSF